MGDPVLRFDEAASQKLGEMKAAGRFDASALRVTVDEEGASFRYQIEVVGADAREDVDEITDCDGIPFYVDRDSAERLRGATLEYHDELSGGGFRFENPNQPKLMANPLAAKVQGVLDADINPGVAAHGGRVSLVDVRDGKVFIRFGGGCQGCGMADVTLKDGVVSSLTSQIPEITEVVDATDHGAGENPYY